MTPWARFVLAAGATALAALYMSTSHSSVIIQGTRFVYPAEEEEIVVRIQNKGSLPSLVQTWLDDGNVRATPTTAKAPFNATPPIFRIEPNEQQAVRVRYTGEPLPQDRESLYWLNVLEVQPKPVNAGGRNLIELSFRTRLRVFYRPQGLPFERAAATSKLTWKLIPYQGGYAVEVANPTPYYISLPSIQLVVSKTGERFAKAPNREENDSLMLPSGDVKRFMLPGLRTLPAGEKEIEFTEMTDFGARVKHSVDLKN
ncbi:molecular chaperone [Pseudomonas sp. O64]|uniref:fimbrial biogenesis chaperone n=1 Tax=unclassified Pseudomonas TaxID=196821 RepID=UPI0021DAA780|nr:fimbria/pilus periplasmic chaperone [Pseudomonas sp. YeP6b]UXZ19923.1 fimbria/pilus periplasmic chaperone [Pseudomonas sp. YeP6b]